MNSPDPFKKELHPDAQVWKEEHDKLKKKTQQQQEIIERVKKYIEEDIENMNRALTMIPKSSGISNEMRKRKLEAKTILKELE